MFMKRHWEWMSHVWDMTWSEKNLDSFGIFFWNTEVPDVVLGRFWAVPKSLERHSGCKNFDQNSPGAGQTPE